MRTDRRNLFRQKRRGRNRRRKSAYDVMRYSEHEIERIARTAFDTARKRTKK
ncbi:MAG: isocitrate/isopropylmalate family dehydrogenase [Christensenellales bacterium]